MGVKTAKARLVSWLCVSPDISLLETRTLGVSGDTWRPWPHVIFAQGHVLLIGSSHESTADASELSGSLQERWH